jgi:hypothetical protein
MTLLLLLILLEEYIWNELHLLHHAASSTYPPQSPHAATSANTTPVAPRVFYAGAFLNNNDDPLAPVANEGQGILHCKPTPPSALLLFIDFPNFHTSSMRMILSVSMHYHQDLFMLRAPEMLVMVEVVMIQVYMMNMAAVK